MAFLSRLFSKKSSSLRSAPTTSRRASTSSSDDEEAIITPPVATGLFSAPVESFGLTNGRRFGTSDRSAPSAGTAGSRRGGEIRRSQTYTCSSYTSVQVSARQSMSSCDGTGQVDDRLRQLYGKLRQSHLGGSAVILEGVERKTKQPVVVKAYAKATMTASMREQVEREQASLRAAAGCSGVVRLIDVIDDAQNIYVVLESAPGCTLIELMAHSGGRLPEARCVHEVVAPLLRALAGLHGLGLVHRELKPEHIMCTQPGAVKLLDMAKAAQKRLGCLNNRVGPLEYMAPEVLSKPTDADIFHTVLYQGMSENELPQYDEKADVWSLGCVVFEALTGQQPFMAESPTELAALHDSLLSNPGPDGLPLLLQHPCISKLARQCLASMLTVDPEQRASALDLLQHPWVQRYAAGGGHAGTSPWLTPAGGSSGAHVSHLHQHHHSSPGGPPMSPQQHQSPGGGVRFLGGGGGGGGSPAPGGSEPNTSSVLQGSSCPESDTSVDSSDSGEGLVGVGATQAGGGVKGGTRATQSVGGTALGWQADVLGLAQLKARGEPQPRAVGAVTPGQQRQQVPQQQVASVSAAQSGARRRVPSGAFDVLVASVDVSVR